MMNFAILFAAFLLCIFIHVTGLALGAILTRQKIEEIAYFHGPTIWRLRIGNVPVLLGCIPIGGYVKTAGDYYASAGSLARAVSMVVGCALLLGSAVLAVGFESAVRSFVNGYWQVPLGALMPWGRGASFARQAITFAGQHDFVTVFGHTAAVILASQLLPIPSFNGGDIVLNILQPLLRFDEQTRYRFALIGTLVGMLMMLSWGVAFVVAMLS